jgi:hypothetical protein
MPPVPPPSPPVPVLVPVPVEAVDAVDVSSSPQLARVKSTGVTEMNTSV